MHEYPYRGDVWVEDIGRGARRISLSGFLLQDAAYGRGDVLAQRAAMIAACETEDHGDGELVQRRGNRRSRLLVGQSMAHLLNRYTGANVNDSLQVSKRHVPNEFLARFDVDGKPRGAHLVMLDYMIADGQIIRETMRLDEAQPADWNSEAIAALLGDYAAQLSAQLSAAQRALDDANARIESMTGDAAQASADSATSGQPTQETKA